MDCRPFGGPSGRPPISDLADSLSRRAKAIGLSIVVLVNEKSTLLEATPDPNGFHRDLEQFSGGRPDVSTPEPSDAV